MKSTTYTEILLTAESREDALSNIDFIARQVQLYDTTRVMIERNGITFFSASISKRYMRYTWANFLNKHSNGATFNVFTPGIVEEILKNA